MKLNETEEGAGEDNFEFGSGEEEESGDEVEEKGSDDGEDIDDI